MGQDNPLLLSGMIIAIGWAAKCWRNDYRAAHAANNPGVFVIKYARGFVDSWW